MKRKNRITKVTVTVRVDYEYDVDELNVTETFSEDSVVKNRSESDDRMMARAGIVLEAMKARLG